VILLEDKEKQLSIHRMQTCLAAGTCNRREMEVAKSHP